MKLLVGIVVMLCVSVGLSGCTDDGTDNTNMDFDKFIGTWGYGSESNLLKYTFYENGTYTHGTTNGTWELDNGQLVLYGFAKLRYNYEFSDNDNTLSITIVGSDVTNWVLTRE